MTVNPEFWAEFTANYVELFNSHDVDGLYEIYSDTGVLVLEPGVALPKSEDMKAGIKEYFATLQPKLTADVKLSYQAGDLVLLIVEWTLTTTADGETTTRAGRAVDILVKDPDGVWRYAVDNHSGTDLPE
ncbi:DUF4440 domain-containing protein [Lentzea guizhouensis]|uniref:DUF4440 domain-containing protein n=1 Tax=Lentzea guizhouensis TaxID=1586287 RepID=A0A1B2HW82_9PSEU|nr:nuclear transport factor 2 family protein [Lentzea guizhouensis]ANZ41984.1 DUF4440 domain-containing protein [Lentzea guizhouensis]